MGPSSWFATWEAKECYYGMAWESLQESSFILRSAESLLLLEKLNDQLIAYEVSPNLLSLVISI